MTARALATIVSLSSLPLLAASPAPPVRSASGAAQRKAAALVPRAPAAPQHTEFVVEVNKRGQVVRVDSGKESRDRAFNAITYGNVLQAFIRRPDGSAVSGRYRLSYDYDPKNKRVRRDVALLQPGGVDPNALGAVDRELQKLASERARERLQTPPTPSPLPDLKTITGHRH